MCNVSLCWLCGWSDSKVRGVLPPATLYVKVPSSGGQKQNCAFSLYLPLAGLQVAINLLDFETDVVASLHL